MDAMVGSGDGKKNVPLWTRHEKQQAKEMAVTSSKLPLLNVRQSDFRKLCETPLLFHCCCNDKRGIIRWTVYQDANEVDTVN